MLEIASLRQIRCSCILYYTNIAQSQKMWKRMVIQQERELFENQL